MRAVRACLAALALVSAGPALAAGGPTAADRDAARGLAKKGYESFEEGAFDKAIDLFQQAEARIHAPPHWLYIARAQVKLGKLREAQKTYDRIVAEKLAADAPAPFKEAQASAKEELGDLRHKIPSIRITLSGESAAAAKVQVDGAAIEAADLGAPIAEDPGAHTIRVTVPGAPPIERSVQLQAGETVEQVNIPVDPPHRPSAAPGIALITVGGLGLAAGGVTLGLYLKSSPRKSAFEIASIASFAGGGAMLGTGIVLLALRPAAEAAPASARAAPRITASIGPGSILIGGSF
jgi:Tetratricopeptide repeat